MIKSFSALITDHLFDWCVEIGGLVCTLRAKAFASDNVSSSEQTRQPSNLNLERQCCQLVFTTHIILCGIKHYPCLYTLNTLLGYLVTSNPGPGTCVHLSVTKENVLICVPPASSVPLYEEKTFLRVDITIWAKGTSC